VAEGEVVGADGEAAGAEGIALGAGAVGEDEPEQERLAARASAVRTARGFCLMADSFTNARGTDDPFARATKPLE
jgi:hypothetical protein